jgi:2-hydroxychromene-2-carboxylate isomerase
MHVLDFWFDPVSPYAALAFERLPEALEGLSVSVTYRPVLFAGLLARWGQLGPAEIVPKRLWTYRQAAWLAHRQGSALQMPSVHPFNPLPLLRLAWACATPPDAPLVVPLDALADAPPNPPTPNRRVAEAILNHVWLGGHDPSDPARLAALAAKLKPSRDPDGDAVKLALRQQGEAAVARGVFGVPTVGVGDELFWGLDALPVLRAYLQRDPWFESPAWQGAADVPVGATRRR